MAPGGDAHGPRLSDLGEIALLRRIQPYLTPPGGALALGAGDDAAVWAPPPGTEVVTTTDTLVEGAHFLPVSSESEARDLGWKLLAVSLSDLAAMGADPGPAFLALALPATWPVACLDGLYQGLAECAGAFGASLAGGNLSAAATPVLTSTCLGSVPAGQALRRAGAGAGWELAVSGRLGGAAAGLRSLDDSSPWRAAWRRRLARPEPRLGVGRIIREAGVRVALDVSDGLYLDASRLLEAGAGDMPSGLLLDAAAIPVEAGVAEAWPADVWVLVGGGEDYEVLFAAPPEVMRQALARIRAAGADATVIGRFDEGRGVRLLIDGREAPPPGAGHEHFASTARG